MSGTYPPSGPQGPQGPQGPPPPYGQGSANEPFGPGAGAPNGPGGYGGPTPPPGYGPPPGQGGYGSQPSFPSSGPSAPTYIGPGATQPLPPVGGPPVGGPPYGQPGPGGPQGTPASMYSTPGGAPPKKKSNGPLIGVIAGAIGLIVVIAIVLGVVLTRGGGNTTGPGPTTGGTTPTEPAKATKPSDAVQGFLEALAAGDSARALSYAATEPSDKTYLTDAVLAATAQTAPITAINVPVVDNEYTSYVSATYLLGKTKVTEDFQVEKAGDEYKMTEVANEVDLTSSRYDSLPMTVGGLKVSDDKILLFPGIYSVSTGLKTIAYGKGVITVKSPSDYTSTTDLRPEITKEGKSALVSAVKAKIASCAKQRALTPKPDCGFGLREGEGVKVDTKTIRWSVKSGGSLSGFDPRLDYDDPTQAYGYLSVRMQFTARGTSDGRSGTFNQTDSIFKAYGNLTKSSIPVILEG